MKKPMKMTKNNDSAPPKVNAIDAFIEESSFDYELEKKLFIDGMDGLKNMSVQELTFYKKWKEIKDYRHFMSKSGEVKAKIWRPKDINDLEGTIAEINGRLVDASFILSHDGLRSNSRSIYPISY
jgi:hypothetical protein